MTYENACDAGSGILNIPYFTTKMYLFMIADRRTVHSADNIVLLTDDSAEDSAILNIASRSKRAYETTGTYLIFRRGINVGIGHTATDLCKRESSHATNMEIVHTPGQILTVYCNRASDGTIGYSIIMLIIERDVTYQPSGCHRDIP